MKNHQTRVLLVHLELVIVMNDCTECFPNNPCDKHRKISYRPVVLESPFAGDIKRNQTYLELCIRDCIMNHHDAPIASHKLYTDALDDGDITERSIGIKCGLTWGQFADACVVYVDHGVSVGMQIGIDHYEAMGIPIIERRLY